MFLAEMYLALGASLTPNVWEKTKNYGKHNSKESFWTKSLVLVLLQVLLKHLAYCDKVHYFP